MLDLNDFFYFVQVVDRGGFTAAGRALGIPKSTLSHRLQELEKSLGVRLLYRTSRRFGTTEAGNEFYRHSVVRLSEAERAETAPLRRLREPKQRSKEVVIPSPPRFVADYMRTWKRAAFTGRGIVALPGYVSREEVRSGTLRRVLPNWRAEDSTLTALMPNRQGVLPSVRAFVKHLAAELPKVVAL